jgi:uncharacterized membrane protein YgcG
MNSRRALVVAGATVTLAMCAGAAFALSDGLADRAPAALQTTSSSLDEFPSTSTTESTTESTEPTTSGSAAPPAPAALSADEATAIALAWVGGGRVVRVEHEFEHGRFEWKVRLVHAGQEWDVRVDAATGAVTRTEHRDGDDDGRRGRHGDDRHHDDRDRHDGDHDDDHDGDRSGRGGGGDDGDNSGRGGSGSGGSGKG